MYVCALSLFILFLVGKMCLVLVVFRTCSASQNQLTVSAEEAVKLPCNEVFLYLENKTIFSGA